MWQLTDIFKWFLQFCERCKTGFDNCIGPLAYFSVSITISSNSVFNWLFDNIWHFVYHELGLKVQKKISDILGHFKPFYLLCGFFGHLLCISDVTKVWQMIVQYFGVSCLPSTGKFVMIQNIGRISAQLTQPFLSKLDLAVL